MSFTCNLGIGMTAGFVVYPIMKIFTGRAGEVTTGLWFLGGLSLLFHILYPGWSDYTQQGRKSCDSRPCCIVSRPEWNQKNVMDPSRIGARRYCRAG